jgi:hypothetical protein
MRRVILSGATAFSLLMLAGSCAPGTGRGGGGPASNGNTLNANGSSNTNTSNENQNANAPPAAARWLVVHQDLPAALRSVQVVANGDVYAVGGDTRDGAGPYVLRFDGAIWVQLRSGLDAGALWWVHEVAPDEIWMCGEQRLILRYWPSTGEFARVDPPAGADTLFGIWGLSRDDVWAVGGTQTRGLVLRYDGTQWAEVDTSIINAAGLPPLFKVWGLSASEVWIVGLGGVLIHFDGLNFTLQQTATQRTLFTVHGTPDGRNITAVGGNQPGEIWELVDGQWTSVAPEASNQVNGVNFGAGGEAFAVGVNASSFRRRDGRWMAEDNGLTPINDLDFHAVWVAPDGSAWAVGGELLRAPFDRGMLAFYGTADPRGPILEAP